MDTKFGTHVRSPFKNSFKNFQFCSISTIDMTIKKENGFPHFIFFLVPRVVSIQNLVQICTYTLFINKKFLNFFYSRNSYCKQAGKRDTDFDF